jgi:hypothetical protein
MDKKMAHSYFLKITYTKEQEIFNFLHNLDFSLPLDFNDPLENKQNALRLTQKYPAESFFELSNLVSKLFINISNNELQFLLDFKFKNTPLRIKSDFNFIKQFYFLNS